jgi:hypothetical protein
MKNALAEWQHKEMLSASNTGGYFAVVHPNDTARQGGHGSARHGLLRCAKVRFGVACLGMAVVARLGISWRGMVSQGLVWPGGQGGVWLGELRYGSLRSGGRGVARIGGVRQVEVWHGGRGPAWRGPV